MVVDRRDIGAGSGRDGTDVGAFESDPAEMVETRLEEPGTCVGLIIHTLD